MFFCLLSFFLSFHFHRNPSLHLLTQRQKSLIIDGSYVITTLNISYTAAYSTSKTASKTAVAYSPNGSKICTFTVTGTFEINSGSSVSCTSASYSKNIYDSTWNFISASTSRNNSSSSKASASAKGYFKNATGGSQTLTPTVYCDKNGNIS